MNPLDLGILSIAAIFFIRGLFRGFVYELITVVGLILGYIISITYLSLLTGVILKYFPTFPESVVKLVSFFILFVGTNLLLRFVANILTKTLKVALLGWLNRLLGGILGVIKSIFIMGIIVFVINLIPFSSTFLDQFDVKESLLFPMLDAVGPKLYEFIKNYTDILF
jgi:membrane protein required for colicin V production